MLFGLLCLFGLFSFYSVFNVLSPVTRRHIRSTHCQAYMPPSNLPTIPCGDDGTRTRDPRLAKAMLSLLSYIPSLWA